MAVSFAPTRNLHLQSRPGHPLKPLEKSLLGPVSLSLATTCHRRVNIATSERRLVVRAGYSDSGRSSGGSIFVGGFVLGGIIVGTLGCVFAPQISNVLAGADRKDLLRKLPNFIYDEDKVLEKTRKVLAEKIAQLNSAIDDVSSSLRTDDGPDGVAVPSVDVEATF